MLSRRRSDPSNSGSVSGQSTANPTTERHDFRLLAGPFARAVDELLAGPSARLASSASSRSAPTGSTSGGSRGKLDEARLLPAADRRTRDVKRLDKLANRQG